jgi:phage tail sheath protein FI
MPISHGLNVTSATGAGSLPIKVTVAIVGLAPTGTVNQLTLLTSPSQAIATYGTATATEKMPDSIAILQRYGIGSIVALRVTTGANATDNASNVAAGLALIPNAYAQLGVKPDVIITPGFPTDAVIAAGIAAAKKCGAVYLGGFAPGTTAAQAITARTGTTTGLGTKDPSFIALFPALKQTANPAIIETYTSHFAGVIARTEHQLGYGVSPSNQPLLGVSAPEIAMSLSYSDETADSEMLNDVGVVSLNRSPSGLVTWGNRNSAFLATNVNNDLFTYINVVRVRNRIQRLVDERAAKFLGQQSNAQTGRLLQESFNSMLANERALKPGSYAVFKEADSNYGQGRLAYQINIGVYVPVEVVDIASFVTLDVAVTV